MAEISDREIYLSRMEKGMFDKLFFIDKVFEPVEYLLDFGCADGALIRSLRGITGEYRCVGYDISEEMAAIAREKQPDVPFFCDWDQIRVPPEKTLLNLSSVIHEVYSYGSREDVGVFWKRVFGSGFRYVAVRDMMFSDAFDGPADKADLQRLRDDRRLEPLLRSYESIWGPVATVRSLTHFLLKYRYPENWEREVRENYFALSYESFLDRIPGCARVVYREHSVLPYVAWRTRKDTGIEVKAPTHIKILLEFGV